MTGLKVSDQILLDRLIRQRSFIDAVIQALERYQAAQWKVSGRRRRSCAGRGAGAKSHRR